MEPTKLAAILGILLGVWVVRTAVPYFIKHRRQGTTFSRKFVISGLVSTFVMVVSVVADQVAIYVIPQGIDPVWVFVGALVTSSGLAGIFNRYGITIWQKQLTEAFEGETGSND